MGIAIACLFLQKRPQARALRPTPPERSCMVRTVSCGTRRRCAMSLTDAMRDDGTIEECLDQLGELMSALRHYPPAVLAVALRVHLEALLQALLEAGLCTRAEVRAFVNELAREALEHEGD
jgi:hypothetical protein